MSTVAERDLAAVAAAESALIGRRRQSTGPRGAWLGWVALAAVVASVAATGVGRRPIVNPGGWPLFARFWAAAARPDVSARFVAQTGRATLTTLAYAVLGTALSLAIGLAGGVLLSRRVLSRRVRSDRPHPLARIGRLVLVVPRGIHEAVWALLLLGILGRDPLVAVLAIGVPFGAITAKVYADLLDASVARDHRTLRCAGATRLQALAYGTMPGTAPELVSYAFYRFECAIRSAAVLGMVGTGGLGFQLSQSFQGLSYREMWTSIYALLALGAAAEWWSARVRRGGPAQRRPTLAAGALLALGSWWYLRPGVSALWSPRTAKRVGRWYAESWPPQLPRRGWAELRSATLATVHISFLAIAGAVALAVPLALASARTRGGRARPAAILGHGAARFVALLIRSVPATVWALLALFVLYPGVVPGAVALGLYTAGVLSRLFAEALENADERPRVVLGAAGVKRLVAFTYGTVPSVAPKWTAFSLYRWEVAARDAAVVGVVGAGGLGRLLTEQTAGFAYPRITTTILALIAVTLAVDGVSTLARSAPR